MTDAEAQRWVLLTGGSRGVGASTVLALVRHGYHVVFTYREKEARARAVMAQAGETATRAVQADVTTASDLERLIDETRTTTPRLAGLVLNASGGMERERLAADPDFPLRLNRDAQLDLLDRALPLLDKGSLVVFVTSHWAHFYGKEPVVPAYEPVAMSKHAGETALRERIPDLTDRGIRLVVVSGDVIEGTITPRLLERSQAGILERRRAQVGALPTTEDMAAAIVQAFEDTSLPSGHTLYVGSTESLGM